jgi:hypothetical protein
MKDHSSSAPREYPSQTCFVLNHTRSQALKAYVGHKKSKSRPRGLNLSVPGTVLDRYWESASEYGFVPNTKHDEGMRQWRVLLYDERNKINKTCHRTRKYRSTFSPGPASGRRAETGAPGLFRLAEAPPAHVVLALPDLYRGGGRCAHRVNSTTCLQ